MCDTCMDYRFVEIPDEPLLQPCPDCRHETSPVARCPVHGQLVMTRDGIVVGKCWGCNNEAAAGLAWMRANPVRVAA